MPDADLHQLLTDLAHTRPAGDPADARPLVARRARRLRLRRRTAAAAGALAVAAGLAAVLFDLTAGPSVTRLDVTAPPAARTSVREGSPVALSRIGDIAFAGADDGYGLATEAGGLYLAVTHDEGTSWAVASGRLEAARGPEAHVGIGPAGELYVWTPGSRSVLTDAGGSWSSATLPAPVQAVAGTGSSLWALVEESTAAFRPPARAALYVSSPTGNGWQRRSTLPSGIGPYEDLVVAPGGMTAYAMAPGERNTYARRYGGLVRTTDGGRRWAAVRGCEPEGSTSCVASTLGVSWGDPCDLDAAPRFDDNSELGATSADDLWLVCGQDFRRSGAGYVSEVERTSDGGQRWSYVDGTFGTDSSPHTFPGTSGVPATQAPDTAVFQGDDAWVILTRPDRVLRTTDGGRDWAPAAPAAVERQGPEEVFTAGRYVAIRTGRAVRLLSGPGRQAVTPSG